MNRLHRMNLGVAAVALAAADTGGLIVNNGPLPRFAGGRLIEVGEAYDPAILDSEAFATASTPAAQLTVAQLEAMLAKRKGEATDDVTLKAERAGLIGSTGDGVNTDVKLAPTSPTSAEPGLSAEQEKAIEAANKAAPADRNAGERVRQDLSEKQADALDRDNRGGAGGSRTKADIAAELTAEGVEFDGRATRDELEKLLADHRAKASG